MNMSWLNNQLIIQERWIWWIKEFISDNITPQNIPSNEYWNNAPKINWSTWIRNLPEWTWTADWVWWVNTIEFNSISYNNVWWSAWDITFSKWDTISVSSWSTGTMTAITYIYLDYESEALEITTTASESVWLNKLLVAVAWPTVSWKDAQYQVFWTFDQSVFITADNIASNTITANEIASNTITANEINVDDIFAQNITATWTITWAHIKTASSNSRIELNSASWLRAYDSSSTLRIQIPNTWDEIDFRDSSGILRWRLLWETFTSSSWTVSVIRNSAWWFSAQWSIVAEWWFLAEATSLFLWQVNFFEDIILRDSASLILNNNVSNSIKTWDWLWEIYFNWTVWRKKDPLNWWTNL